MSDYNMPYSTKKREISLYGLFGKEKLEELQKKLAAVTSFSFSIIDFKGDVITNPLIENTYCDMQKGPGACENCKMASAFAAAKAAFTNDPYLYECQQGLVEAAIPIIINNQYLGAVLCGRVRCSDKENLLEYQYDAFNNSSEIKNIMIASQEEYNKIPEFSCEKIRAVSTLVDDYFKEMCEKESLSIMMEDIQRKDTHIKELRKSLHTLKNQNKKLQTEAIRPKITPQMLLNMFVTVSNFAILEDANKTEEILEDFSSILRYYIENERDRISLAQEFGQIEKYLNIISRQYNKKIKVNMVKNRDAEKQMIPKLSVLPFVEYIVNFGVLSNNNRGTFHIDAIFSVDRCIITLQFESQENYMNSNIGYLKQSGNIMNESLFYEELERIKKRLEYEYDDNFTLKIQPKVIILDLPRTVESKEVGN